MLNQYVNGSGYFEFPSFSVIIFTLLITLVLSTVIALTYKFTFKEPHFPNKLFQAIVLGSTVAALVMMVVGENLALGFVILGAVSITHFKAHIQNPRNALFIFASFSIGISAGKLSYDIAISGTIIFCYIVVLLYYSPPESNTN